MTTHLKMGDMVLAQCKIGLQKKETENQGHFVREDGAMLVCEFAGDQLRYLSPDKVKKFEPIDHEQMQRECLSEFPKVAESVKLACEKLLPSEEFRMGIGGNVDFNEEDATISLLNGIVTIEPAPCRVNTIVGIRELAGWEVSVFRDIPATRMDPPDVDQSSVGIVRGDLNVAQLVVQTLFKIKTDAYFESVGESRMVEEFI